MVLNKVIMKKQHEKRREIFQFLWITVNAIIFYAIL